MDSNYLLNLGTESKAHEHSLENAGSTLNVNGI